MPWKTVDLMDQKLKFVHLAKSGRFTITELCEDFGISRKTGHKYLRRYQERVYPETEFGPLMSPLRREMIMRCLERRLCLFKKAICVDS